MNDTLLIASVAAASAITGGLLHAVIGPWIKHRQEQIVAEKSRRRVPLQTWRTMLLQVERNCEHQNDVGQSLQLHPDYMSLETHLRKETKNALYGDNRTMVVGQSLPLPLEKVKEDIAMLEKKWGLE